MPISPVRPVASLFPTSTLSDAQDVVSNKEPRELRPSRSIASGILQGLEPTPAELNHRRTVGQAFLAKARARIASNVQGKMISKGSIWQQSDGMQKLLLSSARHISQRNLSSLRVQLAPLSIDEQEFVDRFLKEPLYITHATGRLAPIDTPDGRVNLLSRQKLLARNGNFATNHTGWTDQIAVASDDNVFFALEAGETPQKPASRFGTRLLRFRFDQPRVLQAATLHLDDPAADFYGEVGGHFPAIDCYEDDAVSERVESALDDREHHAMESLFQGQDMKIGLSLSIVSACRQAAMPDDMKKNLLGNTDLNSLINHLFRPTIMVPKIFVDFPVNDVLIEHTFEPTLDLPPPGK